MVCSPEFKLRRASALAVAISMAFAGPAGAGPQGATVVNGQVTITQPNAGTTQVQASNGAIINWQKFSIGAGETTRFVQPSASSAVLNRVVGQEASQLLGQLQANGRVFLINPNGIAIGAGARIDTNGFIASTLDMTDADFLAGKLRFFANGLAGGINNRGLITVGPQGQVALIAPNVENSGVIQAPDGQILLAAGRKIEIASLDFDNITFEVQAPTDSVLNLGKLLADNGAVRVFAGNLRHSGEIRANRMVQEADGSIRLVGSNEVTLTADSVTRADGIAGGSVLIESPAGTTRVAGHVSASGTAGQGGDVRVLGERVAVEAGTVIDASGTRGGGQILVGGDFQGKNAAVQNASRVFVDEGVQLRADAGEFGDGGRVIVWADENTRYYGQLSARGGRDGGDGGFAEVSGKKNLDFQGGADLSAAKGESGTLLLDPLDIIVSANGARLPNVTDEFADFQSNVITISPTAINQIGGNVVLQADRDIHFNTETNFTGSSLTASAGMNTPAGAIFLNQNLSTSGGAVNLSGATISGAGSISTAGGAISLTAANGLAYNAQIRSSGGAVTLTATAGSVNNTDVDAGAGTLTVNAAAGSISGNSLTGGTVVLNSSGSQSNTVAAATRVDATSTGSSVSVFNNGVQPLRIGTINGNTGVYLYSSTGMAQVAGGGIVAPLVQLSAQGVNDALGSAAAPLNIATQRLQLYSLDAPAFVALSGNPVLNELRLDGTVAGLGGSSITGAANLSTFALGSGAGRLNLSAVAGAGFSSGLSVSVVDGGINAPTLDIPGPLTIDVAGPAMLGNVNAQSVNLTADEAVDITSATTTGGGIFISAGNCYYYDTGCTAQSPVTVGTLTTSGSGSVNVSTMDNGNIAINTINAGGSVSVSAANYAYADSHPRTAALQLGSVTAGGSMSFQNYGTGGMTASGALTAGNGVSFQIRRGVLDVQGVTATGGNINGTVRDNILFSTIAASGNSSAVSLTSNEGSIRTRNDNTAADIVATGNVSLTTQSASAAGIGNAAFANPLDIKAGADSTVTLSSASAVGAVGKRVNVDVNGAVVVASGDGQFHVAARNAAGVLQRVRSIDLSASASGIGAGNSATFVSQDLSVTAASDGSGIDIGAIEQTVNTLDKFSFAATGASDLTFANVNLATTGQEGHAGYAGYNQFMLSAGGALRQTTPGTNNIAAGHTILAAGGDMLLGNVNILSVAGNAFNASAGGDLMAIDINAPALTLSANNMALGSVTSTGTHRGWPSSVYVPRLRNNQYVTDEIRMTAAASLTTAGNISSQTSAYVDAGTGMSIVGGAGSITGGNTSTSYYHDTVDVNAGSGTLSAADITAHTTRIAGDTLNVNDVTAQSGNLTVAGTHFATGNLTAAGSLNLTATGAYQPGAITISSGSSATITAPDGIDLSAANFSAPTVYFRAENGGIAGNLTGTTGLDLLTGGALNLVTDSVVTSLTMQAKGDQFGAASSITGSGQVFSFATLGGSTASLGFNSATGVQLRYTENSPAAALSRIDLAANLGGSSYLRVAGNQAELRANAVTLTGATDLTTAGDVTLMSVLTGGGRIHAESTNGDVSVGSVTTGGGHATLIAGAGSVLSTGAGGGLVDVGDAVGAPAGNVTLQAANGSIGQTGAEINVRNARGLVVEAANDIALDLGGTLLTNLRITTGASGTGAISFANNTNYSTFSLTRNNGNELVLGPVTPRTAGDFRLYATNGSIKVAGNINVNSLTLHAQDANADLTILAEGGAARTVVATNAASLQAGRDILISAGTGSVESVLVQSSSANITAGRDLSILGDGSSALVDGTSTQNLSAGRNLRIAGGAQAGASATVNTLGSQQLRARVSDTTGSLVIEGGKGSNAKALAQAGSSQTVNAQDLFILGGGGTGASAELVGRGQSFGNVYGGLTVRGGTADNAFAEIRSTASQTLGNQNQWFSDPTDFVLIQGGTHLGTYARAIADGSQSVWTHGDVQVLGGSGDGALAEIQSRGTQNIGSTSTWYGGPTQNILVQGGSAGIARVIAQGSQTIMASGNISVIGGTGKNITASMESVTGAQSIGSGALGASDATDNVFLRAGTETGASAWMRAASGQTVDAGQSIAVSGGALGAAFAEMSTAAGNQTIGNRNAGSDQTDSISVTAGQAMLSDAKISSGGTQTLRATGDITVSNPGADTAAISAVGNQNITAGRLFVTLASLLTGNPLAEVRSDANQTIALDGGADTATLRVSNNSTSTGSLAQVKAGGDQVVSMPYSDKAGLLQIGGNETQGASLLSAGGTQTLLVGEVLVQGGLSAAAAAKILAVGNADISAINGSIRVMGGVAGSAAIDPPVLNLVSNGDIVVQAGAQSTATALIQGGNVNIAATNGNVQTTGGGTAGATAGIVANGTPGTLNLFSAGNVAFTPNAGGATASAPGDTNVFALGTCIGCTPGLIGPGTINIQVGAVAPANGAGTADPTTGDILAMMDSVQDFFGLLTVNDDGEITIDLTRRRLPRCN